MIRSVFLLAALAALPVAGIARAETTAPYAGQDAREIKALSPEYMHGLRTGAGLGFAKTAELNGWPGPLHALELSNELSLSVDQIAVITQIRAEMLAEAKALGANLIAAEAELEALFSGTPDRAALAEATARIAAIQADLRTVHLAAHLRTTPVLSRHQRMVYATARGYGGGTGHGQQGHDHKGHGQ